MMIHKALGALLCAAMVAVPFVAMASAPAYEPCGTPEFAMSRVAPATDGTHASISPNTPNGICYVWEQAEAFNTGVSVATMGTNSKGIAVDFPGAWTYNANWDQCSGDVGSVWDAWVPGENAVMIYEVFNDQSTTGRNYTMIYEDQMDGDGATNFGGGAAPVSPNILTPINDPYLISWDFVTCVIGIDPQTTGFEVPSLFDGYGVWRSITGPISQTNPGTYLGDATLDGGVWKYTDASLTADSWYAVRVKWDGGTFPFYAPLYSYGMSNNLFQYYWPPPPAPIASDLAASPNPHNGNTASEMVFITATVTDQLGDYIIGAECRIGGTIYAMSAQDGMFGDETVEIVMFTYNFPNGYSQGAHTFEVRGQDYSFGWGQWASSSFTITDTTPPLAEWLSTPGSTAYVNQALTFMAGYEDFTAYNSSIWASYFEFRVNNGTWFDMAWTNYSFAWGSYTNTLAYTFPGGTFVMYDYVEYRGQVRDTASTPNTAMLPMGSVYFAPEPGTFNIPVSPGWNLISFPVTASGSPVSVLADADTSWNVIKWYNPQTPSDPWKTYRIGSTANDLTYIDNTMGLWIYITNPGSDNLLRVEGDYPATTQIQLKAGWNLVGYPSLTNETVADALWGTGTDRVEVWDQAEPCLIKEVGSTYVMHAGEGYWVHTIADAVWTITNTPVIPNPYSVYGTVYLYDGTSAGGYNPLVSTGGASVNVTWWDPNIGWKSIVGDTSPTGQFMVDISNYSDGGLVYVNATFDAPYNNNGYNYTYIDVMTGGSCQNVVCGVPYKVKITAPLTGALEIPGVPFQATYVIYDRDGSVAKGYFTFSDGPMEWTSSDILFLPPAAKTFNGISSGGSCSDILTLFGGGYQWINITEGGATELNPYLTPWGAFYIDPNHSIDGWLKDWDRVEIVML